MQEQWVRIVEGMGGKLLVETVPNERVGPTHPDLLSFADTSLGVNVGDVDGDVTLIAAQSTPNPHTQTFVGVLETNSVSENTYINYLPWNTYTTRRFVKFYKKLFICSQASLKHSIINKNKSNQFH